MGTKGTHRSHASCHPYPIPQPVRVGPHTTGGGLRPLLLSNSGVGSFTSHMNRSVKVLWDGTCGIFVLVREDRPRKSNHFQMSLQRQHFLLSYLKTTSVDLAGVWTHDLPLGRPAFSQMSLPGGGQSIKIEVTLNRRITVTIPLCRRNVRRHYARSTWKAQNETEKR